MASPLLPYANALVRVQSAGAVTNVNGRFVSAAGPVYLYRCFLKRQQYPNVGTGGKKEPVAGVNYNNLLPGVSGESFLYRGYYLQKATVADTFDWQGDLGSVTWSDVASSESALKPGTDVLFKLGYTPVMSARVERSSGVFGGSGIDAILYAELGGVQLQLTGAELLS